MPPPHNRLHAARIVFILLRRKIIDFSVLENKRVSSGRAAIESTLRFQAPGFWVYAPG
jgi:hypothetical protein